MAKEHKCGFLRCANGVGLFLAILFAICFVWYYIGPGDKNLYLELLKLSFYGFSGVNLGSFILGAIQSYIWAYIGVGVWWLVGCCFKRGDCDK